MPSEEHPCRSHSYPGIYIEELHSNAHTITAVNIQDHTYSVMTIEQMKQQMEQAMSSLKSSDAKPDLAD